MQSCSCPQPSLPCYVMKDLLILLVHLLTTVAKLLGPGGARTVVANSLLMKQQLLVINRSRRRAPNLSALDRFLLGFWSLFLDPRRLRQAAVIIRPSTLLKFHDLLKKRKYRLLAVFVSRWMGTRQLKLVADINHYPQNGVTIRGYQTATDFFRQQLLRELRIRLGQVGSVQSITVQSVMRKT